MHEVTDAVTVVGNGPEVEDNVPRRRDVARGEEPVLRVVEGVVLEHVGDAAWVAVGEGGGVRPHPHRHLLQGQQMPVDPQPLGRLLRDLALKLQGRAQSFCLVLQRVCCREDDLSELLGGRVRRADNFGAAVEEGAGGARFVRRRHLPIELPERALEGHLQDAVGACLPLLEGVLAEAVKDHHHGVGPVRKLLGPLTRLLDAPPKVLRHAELDALRASPPRELLDLIRDGCV
mmetsp:Transcript_13947/g.34055  ORF Transcript_13947/g.34055 Transcript_13947/m.34055 type:complete len:232 (-) Transcript_13947:1144-1839(-)